jgi:hypothetical protein
MSYSVVYRSDNGVTNLTSDKYHYELMVDELSDLYDVTESMAPGSVAYTPGLDKVALLRDDGEWNLPSAEPIVIWVQPVDTIVKVGAVTQSLTVDAHCNDETDLTYQWYSNDTEDTTSPTTLTGKTAASCAIATAISEGILYHYVVVGDGTNSKTSDIIAVYAATTTNPSAVTTTVGAITGSVTYTLTCSGAAEITYQWYSNTSNSTTGGTAISGATSAEYTIPEDTGVGIWYLYCIATVDDLTITSATAKLTVAAAA